MDEPQTEPRRSFFRFSIVGMACLIALLSVVLSFVRPWRPEWHATFREHVPASEFPLELPQDATDVSFAIHPSGEMIFEFDGSEEDLIEWLKSGIAGTFDRNETPEMKPLEFRAFPRRYWTLSAFTQDRENVRVDEGFRYQYYVKDYGIFWVVFDSEKERSYCRLKTI